MIDSLDNWVTNKLEDGNLIWSVNATEEMVNISSKLTLVEACNLTISSLPASMGGKPAICFSGGIDSQTVVDTFLFAGVIPNVVIFKFCDDLNVQDYSHAIKFCEMRNITPHVIDFDIIRFLNNQLYQFATKYKISSPQFATHLYLAGTLKDLGYTGVIFGGNNLSQMEDKTWYVPTKEETDWYNYSKETNFPIIGSFWLHDWRLSLMATLIMPYYSGEPSQNYQAKVDGYRKMGYDVLPQEQKYNGFENVKKYYEEMTGDGWTFELQFRVPIKKYAGLVKNKSLTISPETETRINILKQQIYKEI